MSPVSQCETCRHWIPSRGVPLRCAAFERIPPDILMVRADHTVPYPGDHGIRYEPRPGTATIPGTMFVLSDRAVAERMPTVQVDVAALDAAWQRDPSRYIPPGGRPDDADRARYERMREFIARARRVGIPIEQPQITVDATDGVTFLDGRHRFAVLRDLGAGRLPVSVERLRAARVKASYGAKR